MNNYYSINEFIENASITFDELYERINDKEIRFTVIEDAAFFPKEYIKNNKLRKDLLRVAQLFKKNDETFVMFLHDTIINGMSIVNYLDENGLNEELYDVIVTS